MKCGETHGSKLRRGLQKGGVGRGAFCPYLNLCLSQRINPLNNEETTGLCYKTLRMCNLREMDRFRSKLVPTGLTKHTSLSKQTD